MHVSYFICGCSNMQSWMQGISQHFLLQMVTLWYWFNQKVTQTLKVIRMTVHEARIEGMQTTTGTKYTCRRHGFNSKFNSSNILHALLLNDIIEFSLQSWRQLLIILVNFFLFFCFCSLFILPPSLVLVLYISYIYWLGAYRVVLSWLKASPG